MMNQYRNPPHATGCGCERGRDTTPNQTRSCGCAPSFRRTPCGGNTPLNRTRCGGNSTAPRTPCGCSTPTEGPTCPLHRGGGQPRQNGCGCDGGRDTCTHLMEQIRAVDFALYETVLYLDAYPHSCDALETYHKLKAQSEALHREYETACGPLTAFGNHSTTSWDWMSKPFPWEYDAD